MRYRHTRNPKRPPGHEPATVPGRYDKHDVQIVSLLVGTVLPILVGIVTTRATDGWVEAVLLAALSAVSGFLSEWLVALNSAADSDWGSVDASRAVPTSAPQMTRS